MFYNSKKSHKQPIVMFRNFTPEQIQKELNNLLRTREDRRTKEFEVMEASEIINLYCTEFCPVIEQMTRMLSKDVSKFESEKLIKKYYRSIAGRQHEDIEDVRSISVLEKCFEFLMNVYKSSEKTAKQRVDAYRFVDNRIRAIKLDLEIISQEILFQNIYQRRIKLLEMIIRFYIVAIYRLYLVEYDLHSVMEQLKKTVATLKNAYSEKDVLHENFDEFSGYYILCNLDNPDVFDYYGLIRKSYCIEEDKPLCYGYIKQCLKLARYYQANTFFRANLDAMAYFISLFWIEPAKRKIMNALKNSLNEKINLSKLTNIVNFDIVDVLESYYYEIIEEKSIGPGMISNKEEKTKGSFHGTLLSVDKSQGSILDSQDLNEDLQNIQKYVDFRIKNTKSKDIEKIIPRSFPLDNFFIHRGNVDYHTFLKIASEYLKYRFDSFVKLNQETESHLHLQPSIPNNTSIKNDELALLMQDLPKNKITNNISISYSQEMRQTRFHSFFRIKTFEQTIRGYLMLRIEKYFFQKYLKSRLKNSIGLKVLMVLDRDIDVVDFSNACYVRSDLFSLALNANFAIETLRSFSYFYELVSLRELTVKEAIKYNLAFFFTTQQKFVEREYYMLNKIVNPQLIDGYGNVKGNISLERCILLSQYKRLRIAKLNDLRTLEKLDYLIRLRKMNEVRETMEQIIYDILKGRDHPNIDVYLESID